MTERNGLSAKLESLHASGEWRQNWVSVEEVERRLAVCRGCGGFDNREGCDQHRSRKDRLKLFVTMLVDQRLGCVWWVV